MQDQLPTDDLADIYQVLNEQSNFVRARRHSVILGLIFLVVLAILPTKDESTPTPKTTSPTTDVHGTVLAGTSALDSMTHDHKVK